MFKIEKGVEMAIAREFKGRGCRRSVYPFMEMEIGDSIFDPNAASTATSKAYQSAKKYAQRSGDRKFSAQQMDGGIRIWRIM